MFTDPIADLLTRIRNANMLSKAKVELSSSNIKEKVVSVLKREGFIKGYRVVVQGKKRILQIYLRYSEDGKGLITHLERVSKPGRRRFAKEGEVPRAVRERLGICILSTSKGILTAEEAHKLGVGGEILCYVW